MVCPPVTISERFEIPARDSTDQATLDEDAVQVLQDLGLPVLKPRLIQERTVVVLPCQRSPPWMSPCTRVSSSRKSRVLRPFSGQTLLRKAPPRQSVCRLARRVCSRSSPLPL